MNLQLPLIMNYEFCSYMKCTLTHEMSMKLLDVLIIICL